MMGGHVGYLLQQLLRAAGGAPALLHGTAPGHRLDWEGGPSLPLASLLPGLRF